MASSAAIRSVAFTRAVALLASDCSESENATAISAIAEIIDDKMREKAAAACTRVESTLNAPKETKKLAATTSKRTAAVATIITRIVFLFIAPLLHLGRLRASLAPVGTIFSKPMAPDRRSASALTVTQELRK